MTTALELIVTQIDRNQQKVDEIARLQKQLKSSDNRLDNKLVKHYIESEETLDSEMLLESFGLQRVKKIVVNILKKTTLQKEVILQPIVLQTLERLTDEEVKKVNDNIQKSFETLSLAEKITFSLFCGGLINLYKKYSFAEKFLVEKFDIQEYSKDQESILGVCGYNFETYQSTFKITMKKDDVEGAKRIAKAIDEIISTGAYVNTYFDIFESTLSRYDNIYLELQDENGTLTPAVCKGRYDSFTSKKETFLEQLIECLEYTAKYHAYYGVEEEEEGIF